MLQMPMQMPMTLQGQLWDRLSTLIHKEFGDNDNGYISLYNRQKAVSEATGYNLVQ
jgi:hypothetical protein